MRLRIIHEVALSLEVKLEDMDSLLMNCVYKLYHDEQRLKTADEIVEARIGEI